MAMFLFFVLCVFFLHWRRRQCADDDDGVNAYYIRQSVSYNFIHTLLLLWSFIASHYYRPPVMERSWWCTTFQFLKRLIEKKMSHWIKKKLSIEAAREFPSKVHLIWFTTSTDKTLPVSIHMRASWILIKLKQIKLKIIKCCVDYKIK